MDQDTIVAVSSASGSGLRGIIRISGSQAFPLVRRMWQSSLTPRVYKWEQGRLHLEQWQTDISATVYLMQAPHSYTREDCVEIHTLSNPILQEVILKQLVVAGARPAHPGEFTRRAFLAGRIDLAQAEAVMTLVSASNEAERRMALTGVSGVLSQKIAEIQDSLAYLVALMEAHIDFLEEEVPPLAEEEVTSRLQEAKIQLQKLGSSEREIAEEALVVCLCGLPNAGKSTLFNALAEENVALTSDIAGTTLDWLEATKVVAGMKIKFIDTPGIEEAPVRLQAKAQQKVASLLQEADMALFLTDSSSPFAEENHRLLQMLPPVPTLLVYSKSDLAVGVPPCTEGADFDETRTVSAVTGQGIDQVYRWLAETGAQVQQHRAPRLLSTRQFHSVQKTIEYVDDAARDLEMGMSYEFVVVNLRCALDALGEIAGKVTTEEILDRVFSRFCIGK